MVGGVPTVTRDLARGLGGRGHAVAVVAPSADAARARRRRAGDGRAARWPSTTAARCRGPGTRASASGCCRRRAAGRAISAFAPDVVHLHSPLTLGAAARTAARRRRRPGGLHQPLPAAQRLARGGTVRKAAGAARGPRRGRDAAFYGFVTGFANRCDLVTAPTATALRLLRYHGLRVPSQAVSNGVDLDRFSPGPATRRCGRSTRCPPGRPVVLSVGRLSAEKRGGRADRGDLQAARPRTPAPRTRARSWSSPGPARTRAGCARSPAITAWRTWSASSASCPTSDLPGLYRLADVFAIASQAELQSLATMAAMASGLPVVAVDAGALAELVHPGENGFLARPGTRREVAECLGLLCRDAGCGRGCRRLPRGSSATTTGIACSAGGNPSTARSPRRRGTAAEQAKVSDGQP